MSPSFLEKLAQTQPDPGGGAAAAYGARLGLALVEKVIKLEVRRAARDQKQTHLWQENLIKVRKFEAALARLQDEDVQAYLNLARVRASGAQGQKLAAAIQEALAVPRQIMEQAHQGQHLLSWVGDHCRRHLVSDLLVACEFLEAALTGAYHIACANLPLIIETSRRQALGQALSQAY